MAAKRKEKARPRLTMVCIGKRPKTKGGLGYLYHRVESVEAAAKITAAEYLGWREWSHEATEAQIEKWHEARSMFAGKAMGSVGTIFTVEHEPGNEGTVFPNTTQHVGFLPITTRKHLLAEHTAIEDEASLERSIKKEASDDPLVKQHLEPLKQIYMNLKSCRARTVFMARIIEHLTRW